MKLLIATTLMLFSLQSMAEHHDHKDWEEKIDKMSFEDAKKMKLEKLDKKREWIEQSRNCVNNAKDKEALKSCMREMKAEKKEMKAEMKEKMKK